MTLKISTYLPDVVGLVSGRVRWMGSFGFAGWVFGMKWDWKTHGLLDQCHVDYPSARLCIPIFNSSLLFLQGSVATLSTIGLDERFSRRFLEFGSRYSRKPPGRRLCLWGSWRRVEIGNGLCVGGGRRFEIGLSREKHQSPRKSFQ